MTPGIVSSKGPAIPEPWSDRTGVGMGRCPWPTWFFWISYGVVCEITQLNFFSFRVWMAHIRHIQQKVFEFVFQKQMHHHYPSSSFRSSSSKPASSKCSKESWPFWTKSIPASKVFEEKTRDSNSRGIRCGPWLYCWKQTIYWAKNVMGIHSLSC